MIDLMVWNKQKNSLTEQQIQELDELLARDPSEIVAYVLQKIPHQSQWYIEAAVKDLYQLIFEYAVFREKYSFIKKLPYSHIIKYLDAELLLSYAETQGHDFFEMIVVELENFSKQNNKNRSFLAVKQRDITETSLYSNLSEWDAIFIRTMLLHPQIDQSVRMLHTRSLVNYFCASWPIGSQNLQNIQERLFSYTDKAFHVSIFAQLFHYQSYSADKSPAIRDIAVTWLESYPWSEEQIVNLFDNLGFDIPRPQLERLIKQLVEIKEQPNSRWWARVKHVMGSVVRNFSISNLFRPWRLLQPRSRYENYQLVADFLALASEQHEAFIIQNHEKLLTNRISGAFPRKLIRFLSKETQKSLVKYYISCPEFRGEMLFKCLVFELNDHQLIEDYLRAPHTLLIPDCLPTLMTLSSQPSNLIRLLVQRGDYVFTKQNTFKPLLTLFFGNDFESIALLLSHPVIVDLLSDYYELRGDDELSHENRGMLMPYVLAWYFSSPDTRPLGKRLFLSFKSMHEVILKNTIPAQLDPTQPTLLHYLMKVGDEEILRSIGGAEPRLICAGPTLFMPVLWKNPGFNRTHHQFQKKIAVDFAKKINISRATEIADPVKMKAAEIARLYGNSPITLQHQTLLSSAKKILGTDGRLKSRLHLLGHRFFGNESQGLIAPWVPTNDPNSAFSYFSRVATSDHGGAKIIIYSKNSTSDIARFVFNAVQVIKENPHIQFISLNNVPNDFEEKKLQFADGQVVSSGALRQSSAYKKISIPNATETSFRVHQALFELVIHFFINPLKEPLKSTILERLTNLDIAENRVLADELLDLLPLEWLVPGDVQLKFSYVDLIECGDKTYSIADLRDTALHATEDLVLDAIARFTDIEHFPFVINGIIRIALTRGHNQVIKELYKIKPTTQNHTHTVFYPNELYEVESLMQLQLEDLNSQRVYVHQAGNTVSIQSTLKIDSNRGGAHHAEMAKLIHALGLADFTGQNALEKTLPDSFQVTLGEGEQFTSLAEMLNVLLTFELTTLLVSQQNLDYYLQHQGAFHPITGKGASNGVVALLANRLFTEDEEPYQITVRCDDDGKNIVLTTTRPNTLFLIAARIKQVLNIEPENISIVNAKVTLKLSPANLIAKLRQQAVFYEGINVITDDGRLLLAERYGKGLASAGGHHSDKYNKQGIAYGLNSEFGLLFKEPEKLEENVVLLQMVDKTGIYVVFARALIAPERGGASGSQQTISIDFRADRDEFKPGSEVALTLTEMRGRQFYDVMPIAELGQYQLNLLKEYIHAHLPDADIELEINCEVKQMVMNNVCYKVPSESFGRVFITINGVLPDELKILEKQALPQQSMANGYAFDESPLSLLKTIKDACIARASEDESHSMVVGARLRMTQ